MGAAEINTIIQSDRRTVQRHSRSFPVTLIPVGGEAVPAVLRDLSVRGLGLLSARPYRLSTLVCIRVPGADGSEASEFPAVVKWLTPDPDGGWVIGCMLIRTLGE